MSLRRFLILLPLCALGGFLFGFFAWARLGGAGSTPGGALEDGEAERARERSEEARSALARLRSDADEAARAGGRKAFLERFPDSWLRATWPAEGSPGGGR